MAMRKTIYIFFPSKVLAGAAIIDYTAGLLLQLLQAVNYVRQTVVCARGRMLPRCPSRLTAVWREAVSE